MKKNSSIWYLILGIVFIATNVIIFTIPSLKTTSFWISYAFMLLSFIIQIVLWNKTLGKDKPLKSKFLGLPLILIGGAYLIVQILASFVFLFVPILPTWSSIIICTITTCSSIILLLAVNTSKDNLSQIDDKIKQKTNYLKNLQIDLEMLSKKENDHSIQISLADLAEKVRFSDPISNGAVFELEDNIANKVKELNHVKDKEKIIKEINLLLDERNKKCKLLK